MEKLKKDSTKEMENNERLTALQSRISEEIKLIKKLYDADKGKYLTLESNFVKVSKLVEQNEKEFNNVQTVCLIVFLDSSVVKYVHPREGVPQARENYSKINFQNDNYFQEYDSILNEEKLVMKELCKYESHKRGLEDDLIVKLDDKVSHDKTLRHLNKLLHESKDSNLENDLVLTRLENSYGKTLLELEKINSLLDNERFDLDAVEKRNFEKQKDIENLQIESRNYDMLLKQKERKIAVLDKKIQEV